MMPTSQVRPCWPRMAARRWPTGKPVARATIKRRSTRCLWPSGRSCAAPGCWPGARGRRRDAVGRARPRLLRSAGRAVRSARPSRWRPRARSCCCPGAAGRCSAGASRSRACCSGGPRSSPPTSATGSPRSRSCPTPRRDGDLVTLHGVRNFDYRTEQDFVARYDERTFDLRKLDAVDLVAVYWVGDAIAHVIVSFGFAGDHVAFSIETRKEKGEAYSSLAGFFRRYELIYIVGDERDLIRVRTNYRRAARAGLSLPDARRPRGGARSVPRVRREDQPAARVAGVLQHAHHQLHDRRLAAGARAVGPLSPRLAGAGERPFPRVRLRSRQPRHQPAVRGAKALSLINDKAQAADQAPEFSQRIREGLPRPPSRAGPDTHERG